MSLLGVSGFVIHFVVGAFELRHSVFIYESADVALTHLELKEESEKGRLSRMKENQNYKRLDLYSTLAVLGVLAVLVFECFFVFEFYNRDLEPLERFLPATEAPAPVQESIEEAVPVG